MAAGLPTIRADASERRALDGTDREPPTCRPDELVSDLAAGARGSTLVVVNERRIVLGRFRAGAASADGAARVEEVMEPGPSTVRPHRAASRVADQLAERDLRWAIVTDPDGRLIGVARRDDLEGA